MSSQFWGARMQPGKKYLVKYPGILNLNQVCLAENPKEGKTVLKVFAKGETFVLCTLVKNMIEHQRLSHFLIAEDEAVLMLEGANPVDIVGTLEYDDADSDEDYEVDQGDMELMDTEEDSLETVTGEPRYANYLSDLLGPDLPEDDDDEYEDLDDDDGQDEHGTTAFRDVTDNTLLGGFELRHFNLAPHVNGYEKINLREQEEDMEDSLLNDNIARGLANALINSGDELQMRKGVEVLKKLKKLSKKRKLL